MGLSISSFDPTTSDGLGNIATGGLHSVTKDPIDDFYQGITGETAAKAAEEAAATQAGLMQQGLDYYIGTEEIPQELRQLGLQQLGGLAGLPGYEQYGDQQALIQQAKADPLYQAQLGIGREALARQAAGGSGARGTGTVSSLAGFESNLLGQSYQNQLGQIQNLAQLPSQAGNISQGYGQIGSTLAQGQVASANAQSQGMSNLLGLGGTLGAAYISDMRLKTAITKIGTTSHPYIDKYEWEWLENNLGKEGKETGYIAQEVEQVYPEFIIEGQDGYKRILKDKLEEKLKELN